MPCGKSVLVRGMDAALPTASKGAQSVLGGSRCHGQERQRTGWERGGCESSGKLSVILNEEVRVSLREQCCWEAGLRGRGEG